MDFNDYQQRAGNTDQNPKPPASTEEVSHNPQKHETIPLLGLVGEVGSLLAEYKKVLRDGATHRNFRSEVAEELGDILWYVANVATKFDLSLAEVAQQNLDKVEDRWRSPDAPHRIYDEIFAENERLPRQFAYRFEHRPIKGIVKVVLVDCLAGDTVGDPLADNTYEDDSYRYHDALHLTFAACLQWSPVLRKLLRDKGQIVNRPAPFADAEDGGRARVIEEAIVAAAYVYASMHNFLEDLDAVDWHLLRHIKQLTSNVEVADQTAWEWNHALIRGFKVWRLLRENEGGIVSGDLLTGVIDFTPP